MENKSVIIPVQFEAGSVFVVRKDAIESAVAKSEEYTDGKNVEITNKLSTIEQTADSIDARVTRNETNISTLTGKITSTETNYSNLKLQADSIEANVASNKTSINDLNAKYTEQQSSISLNSNKINSAVNDVTALKGRMDTYEGNYSSIEQKADSIESTVNSMKTATGNNMFSFKNANFERSYVYIQDYGFICPPYNNSPCRVFNLGTNGRGGEYVVSFDIYSWGQCPELNLCFCKAAGIRYTPVANAWKHVDLKYTVSNDDPYIASDDYNGFFYISDNISTNLAIRNFQVVRGNVASEFSYSQDDLNDVENKDLGITNTINAENYTVLDNSDPNNPTYVQKTERYTLSEENVDGKTRDVYTLNYKQKEIDFDFITSNGNFTLKQNRAYTLSFYAKKTDTDANYIICHLQPSILGSTYETLYKPSDLIKKAISDGKSAKEAESPYIGKQSISASSDGYTEVILDSKWRKYYIHFYVQNQSSNLNYVAARIPANSTDFTLSISDVKLEEGFVTGDYNSYKSVIRQTSQEILQQVGNTYIKIGDAITLNGDTNVNGTLTLKDDSEKGFLLLDSEGNQTRIASQTIGKYDDFLKASISNNRFDTMSGLWTFDSNRGIRSMDLAQNIGNIKAGSNISFSDVSVYVLDMITNKFLPASAFTNVTLSLYNDYNTSPALIFSRNIAVSSVMYSGRNPYYYGAIKAFDSFNTITTGGDLSVVLHLEISNNTLTGAGSDICGAYVSWTTRSPISDAGAYTLIGYDGIASRLGNGSVVYIGKEGFHAKYGNYEFSINNNGIVGNNIHRIKVLDRNNSNYTIKDNDIYDTFISYNPSQISVKLVFPRNPYDGQTIMCLVKGSGTFYIDYNGKSYIHYSTSSKTSTSKDYELGDKHEWQYIYSAEMDCWIEMIYNW